MIINFKEIPAGNTGGDGQDQFELFGRDFLEELGFKIIQHPSRGADGKKDMIVYGRWDNKEEINWLVSCKHNAHSKTLRAVNDKDEINILERLKVNNCKGFIGLYSTIAATSLSNLLLGLRKEIDSQIFDHRRIENLIIQRPERHKLFWRYFVNSYDKYKSYLNEKQTSDMNTSKKQSGASLSEEDFLRISKTALIIVETEKIKERYFDAEWNEREKILGEFYKYSDHTNLTIAEYIFTFLSDAATQTRGGMTPKVAISILSLTMNFFPYSEDKKDKERIIELGTQCVNTAFSMIYDASIHMKDYKVIMYGLTILKYIYKKGEQENLSTLIKKVKTAYEELEETLQRPERNDLSDALDLIRVFKNSIEEGSLSFPLLPKHLNKIVYPNG
jgi:hypothetical protein